MAAQASTQDGAIGTMADRTAALRTSIERLAGEIREVSGLQSAKPVAAPTGSRPWRER